MPKFGDEDYCYKAICANCFLPVLEGFECKSEICIEYFNEHQGDHFLGFEDDLC